MLQFPQATASIVKTSDGSVRLEAPGFSSKVSPGDPALPCKVISVLLPANADTKTLKLRIMDQIVEDVPGRMDVGPAARAPRNDSTYRSRLAYPGTFAMLDGSARLGPYILAKVRCWPYQYSPASMTLKRLVSGRIVISFDTLEKHPRPTGKQVARYLDRLQAVAENWQESLWWYGLPEGGRKLGIKGPANAMLLITTSDIQKASTKLEEYIAHKRKMGFTVDMVNESAWGGGTDAVAAERIRNYLKTVYTKYHYLLIIGDPRYESQVPMKKTYPYWFDFPHTGDINTDYYYAELTGNWDRNGNGFYAEWQRDGGLSDFGPGGVDLIPELVVGRIPYYGKPEDLDKILAKTIRYETMPEVGDWVQRVLIPMKPFSDREPSSMYGEPPKDDIFLPAGYGYYRVYDADYGLVPAPEAYPCTSKAVLEEWKKGYGFVFWGTHGGGDGASSVFYSNQAKELDDSKPAFTFQGSCFTAQPEVTNNLAYSLLLNGAVVTLASTRMSGGGWDDGNIGIGYAYAKNLIGKHMPAGDAYWQGIADITLGQAVWNNHCSYVIYGDPTLKIRWPTSFEVATPSQLRAAQAGKTYGEDLFAAGAVAPYEWSVANGDLPPGLKLEASGKLSGTPTTAGDYRFTLQVKSSGEKPNTVSSEFALKVAEQAQAATK